MSYLAPPLGGTFPSNQPKDTLLQHLVLDRSESPKQHFIEYFDGEIINTIWTKENITGTGTFTMVGTIDSGFKVQCASGSGNHSALTFNLKRQYEEDGCIMINISRLTQNAAVLAGTGFIDDAPLDEDFAYNGVDTGIDSSNFILATRRTGTFSGTSLGVALDTSFHLFELEMFSTGAKTHMDGVLAATRTTDHSTSPQQPGLFSKSFSAGTRTINCRYMEIYNT